METIGDRILKLRKKYNMSQKELSEKAGITEATLSRYENNKREPKGEIIAKLAHALNISTDFLLGFENKNQSPHNLDPETAKLLKKISSLSEESKKDLEKQIELLKIRDSMDKAKNETLSTSEEQG